MTAQRLIEILQEFVEEHGDATLRAHVQHLDGSCCTCPLTDIYAYGTGSRFLPNDFTFYIREEDTEEHDDAN